MPGWLTCGARCRPQQHAGQPPAARQSRAAWGLGCCTPTPPQVPERVNEAFAEAAARARVPVLLDAGGSQDSLSPDLLALVDYICPNELELAALTGMPTDTDEHALAAARALYAAGARNVLATLGARGALLLLADNSSSGFSEGRCGDDTPTAMWQRALPVPGGAVLDATAAGDAFRAAFAVALAEGQALAQCLELGAAAGAIAASRPGAMPSLPTRRECDALLASPAVTSLPPEPARPQLEPGRCEEDGSGQPADADDPAGSPGAADSAGAPGAAAPAAASLATPAGKLAGAGLPAQADCPLLFASRLNSLAHASGAASASSGGGNGDGAPLPHVLAWVGAQGGVEGLDLVYFNYPQHLHDLAAPQVCGAARGVDGAEGGAGGDTGGAGGGAGDGNMQGRAGGGCQHASLAALAGAGGTGQSRAAGGRRGHAFPRALQGR